MDKIKLKRLEKEDVANLKDKELYCYEKSEAYLLELKEEFPEVLENLKGIIDDNRRNQGKQFFAGKYLP